jgi:hypothetical protein
MNELTISSPDRKKGIEITYIDEVRFGPAYFSCKPIGFECPFIKTKMIGQDIFWSDDSRFVFLVIFHSTDSSKAPDMELLQIDTKKNGITSIERNFSGKISLIGFIKNHIEYESVTKEVVENKKFLVNP